MSQPQKPTSERYLILRVEDAHKLARSPETGDDIVIAENVLADTGGDIAEIADLLKGLEICCACSNESQQRSCSSPTANKLGRRLRRLLDRADARSSRHVAKGEA